MKRFDNNIILLTYKWYETSLQRKTKLHLYIQSIHIENIFNVLYDLREDAKRKKMKQKSKIIQHDIQYLYTYCSQGHICKKYYNSKLYV